MGKKKHRLENTTSTTGERLQDCTELRRIDAHTGRCTLIGRLPHIRPMYVNAGVYACMNMHMYASVRMSTCVCASIKIPRCIFTCTSPYIDRSVYKRGRACIHRSSVLPPGDLSVYRETNQDDSN